MKFLILLFYYERPEMLRNALDSVKQSSYKNWDLCVIDDGVNFPGVQAIDDCFGIEERKEHRISYVQTMDSIERKSKRGGSQFGLYANTAIEASDADIVIMLCDDDILMDDYMERLDEFYSMNPGVMYSYCHLKFYDPLKGENTEQNSVADGYTRYLNSNTHPINPVRKVDSSQVSWRRTNAKDAGIKFPYPRTSNLDEVIFSQMYSAWGVCVFNGITGQWKGIHEGQLINQSRKKR
jgi:glycosyltransferase involved in cell wall biosynthesis